MQIARKYLVWAIMLCGLAGAGINLSSRFNGASGEPPLRLSLNIPASRLDVFEDGELTRAYQVSVGARGFETPAGKYRVNRVVWNPWWHPPDSKWARDRKPTAPGPDNPMGRVKLQFAELLYIHGTTDEERLGVPASHGCVRMANRDLIELTRLVHEYTTPGLRGELLVQLEANPRQTRTFYLRQTVPLAVIYDLVEVRNGQLTIHPDVYRAKGAQSVREQVLAALEKAGVNVSAIGAKRLEQITRLRNSTRLTIALDTLIAGSGSLER